MQLDMTPAVTWDSSFAVKIANSGKADSSPRKERKKQMGGCLEIFQEKARKSKIKARGVTQAE